MRLEWGEEGGQFLAVTCDLHWLLDGMRVEFETEGSYAFALVAARICAPEVPPSWVLAAVAALGQRIYPGGELPISDKHVNAVKTWTNYVGYGLAMKLRRDVEGEGVKEAAANLALIAPPSGDVPSAVDLL